MNQPMEPIASPAGLTKREYFAAIALQGLLINGSHRLQSQEAFGVAESRFAEIAVRLADETLTRLQCDPDDPF